MTRDFGALKRVRAVVAAAMLAAVAVLGMPAAKAQTPPDVLVVGQIAEPKSLDPQTVTAVNDFRILMNIYDGLVRYKDGTLEVEPALAESWTIGDDGLVYTFTLREGVSFHDGNPLTAQAVKFNFDRMLDEAHPYHDTEPFPLSFFFSAIDSVEAKDERTVEFILNEPYAPFLSNLAYPTGLIVSPSAVERHGKDFGRNPSGTGPFRFAEWESNAKVKADMAEMAWMTNDPDTLPYLALRTDAFPDKGGFNSGYYSNPKVDALLEAARRSTDQAERARLYREMQEIVRDDAPWAFIANWKQNAVTSERVSGFKLQPSFFLLLGGVSKS